MPSRQSDTSMSGHPQKLLSRRRAAAQGSGKQARGAVVNLVAFYMVGIPLALGLAFPLRMGAAGLMLGLLAGSAVQARPRLSPSSWHPCRTGRRRCC